MAGFIPLMALKEKVGEMRAMVGGLIGEARRVVGID